MHRIKGPGLAFQLSLVRFRNATKRTKTIPARIFMAGHHTAGNGGQAFEDRIASMASASISRRMRTVNPSLLSSKALRTAGAGRERIDMESFSVVPSLPLLLSMEDRSHAGIS
jgi:hypothetical protein